MFRFEPELKRFETVWFGDRFRIFSFFKQLGLAYGLNDSVRIRTFIDSTVCGLIGFKPLFTWLACLGFRVSGKLCGKLIDLVVSNGLVRLELNHVNYVWLNGLKGSVRSG